MIFIKKILAAGVLLTILSCSGISIKKETLIGKWKLISLRYKGREKSFQTRDMVSYHFLKNGVIYSYVDGRTYSGRWNLKGNLLTAYWTGRHREKHLIERLSAGELIFRSRNGELVTHFRRIRR
jgi:hypothetical protein